MYVIILMLPVLQDYLLEIASNLVSIRTTKNVIEGFFSIYSNGSC